MGDEVPTPNTIFGDPDPNYYETAYGQLISSYGDLVKKVLDQNNKIDEQIQEYEKMHSSDYQKSIYENQSTYNLHVVYNYLFYTYYLCLVIVFIYGFFKGAWSFAKPEKLIMFMILLVFPYVIYPIEKFVYMLGLYVWSFFTDNVYSNVYITENY
jgi:hypothetical protein